MILDTIDKINPLQVKMLLQITQDLVLTRGHDNVKLGSDYNPDAEEKIEFGYIFESGMVHKNRTHSRETIEASLDYMASIGVIEVASARGWTQIGGKTGVKGFRPTQLGLKTLEYLGKPIEGMQSIADLIKKQKESEKGDSKSKKSK